MPEIPGGGMGAVGGAMRGVGAVSSAPAAPAMSSIEGLGAPRMPEATPQAPEVAKPEPTGAEATGPEAANKVTDMAKQGPEAGMTQLANLDLDKLDTEVQQKGNESTLPGEKPVLESTGVSGQTNEGVDGQGAQRTETAQEATSVTGTPAEEMDTDPRYKAVQEELKQKWLQEHPGQGLLSENGQNYNLGYIDPKQRDLPTLKSDTDKAFRERYPDDAKGYDAKEKSRIYEDSSQDPAVKQVEEGILRSTNLDSQVRAANTATGVDSYSNVWDRVHTREGIHAWDSFIDQYPDKAKAYADKGHPEIKRALEGRERRRQAQEQQQAQTSGEGSQPANSTTESTAQDASANEADKKDASASEDQATIDKKDESDENKTTEQKDEKTEGEEAKPEAERLSDAEQRIQQLEDRFNQLSAKNEALRANIEPIVKIIIELLPAIKLLLEQQQAQEKDPKKKETLASLLLKIAAVIALGVVGSAVSAGESAMKQG